MGEATSKKRTFKGDLQYIKGKFAVPFSELTY